MPAELHLTQYEVEQFARSKVWRAIQATIDLRIGNLQEEEFYLVRQAEHPILMKDEEGNLIGISSIPDEAIVRKTLARQYRTDELIYVRDSILDEILAIQAQVETEEELDHDNEE